MNPTVFRYVLAILGVVVAVLAWVWPNLPVEARAALSGLGMFLLGKEAMAPTGTFVVKKTLPPEPKDE